MAKETERRALAREALRLTRLRLGQKLPGFTAAFAVMRTEWTKEPSGTDAVYMYWNAREVLRLFGESPETLQRRYLHLILHGLYLHRFRGGDVPERIWQLACDVVTEYRIDRLNVPGFERPVAPERSRVYRSWKESGFIPSERTAAAWLAGKDEAALAELENIFRRDNHDFWKKPAGPQDRDESPTEKPSKHQDMQERRRKEPAGRTAELTAAVCKWRTAYEQIEQWDGEHKRQAGGSAGTQEQQVVLEKERGYDYRQFLKRFAVEGEELAVDMDSFDYIPYDYSRRMYESLVLLEPLEYRDVHRLQEFVIAIDTSGSCSGEIVRQFLEETWEILQEKDNFFRDMRIHLIQCDCLVQEHVCVSSVEEWEDCLTHLTVKGHGDTDFTPVFRLVDQMLSDGELKDLRGLLYFTDGDGIYPSRKPVYETAFVFLNERLRKGKAPEWALTLTLDRELETLT